MILIGCLILMNDLEALGSLFSLHSTLGAGGCSLWRVVLSLNPDLSKNRVPPNSGGFPHLFR